MIVLLIIIIIVVIVVIVVVIRRRKVINGFNLKDIDVNDEREFPSWLKDVPAASFKESVKKMNDRDWERQFEALNIHQHELDETKWGGKSKEQRYPTATLPENLKKNRYTNILPTESSRVKLKVIDDSADTDYINANWISVSSIYSLYFFQL